jgi:hypothetical protein
MKSPGNCPPYKAPGSSLQLFYHVYQIQGFLMGLSAYYGDGRKISRTFTYIKLDELGQVWWFTLTIATTQEVDIRRIMVQDQPRPKKKKTINETHLNQ